MFREVCDCYAIKVIGEILLDGLCVYEVAIIYRAFDNSTQSQYSGLGTDGTQ